MKKFLLYFPIAIALVILFVLIQCIKTYPLKYSAEIKAQAKENEISAPLVASIIYAESCFQKNATSNKGAVGLMQIMPQTAEWIASELNTAGYNLFDEKTNIAFGCYYLKYLHEKFDSEIEVLCAYNAGESKTREWQTQLGKITQENIPFAETKNYVKKVFDAKKYYSKIFPS